MRWDGCSIVLVITAFALACGESGNRAAPLAAGRSAGRSLQPDLATAVYRFLECTECTDGELQALVARGDSAVPMLTELIIQGPPAAKIDMLRRSLNARYRKVLDYSRDPEDSALVPPRVTYVEVPLANYVATYRSRSAYALGQIRGAAARRALDSARVLDSTGVFPPRSDVTASIQSALANF